MSRDPIVEEIRQARQKLLDECGGDLDKLLDRFKASETYSRGRVVDPMAIRKPNLEVRPTTSR
jgi:hypothetical protein